MNISVILAHPDETSFNHAIAHAAVAQLERNGHVVAFHNFQKEAFDPLLTAAEIPRDAVLPETIKMHCNDITEADGIIIVHPNWWGQPPALMKGRITLRPRLPEALVLAIWHRQFLKQITTN